jgi:hypothetical protein
MNILPTEIIINFCQYLNSFDLIRFSSTNSEYRNLIKNHQWDTICTINTEDNLKGIISNFRFKRYDLSFISLTSEELEIFNLAEYLNLSNNDLLRIDSFRGFKFDQVVSPSGKLITSSLNLIPGKYYYLCNSIIKNNLMIPYSERILFNDCIFQSTISIESEYPNKNIAIILTDCFFEEDTFKDVSVRCFTIVSGYITVDLIKQLKKCNIVHLQNVKCNAEDYHHIRKNFSLSNDCVSIISLYEIVLHHATIYFFH